MLYQTKHPKNREGSVLLAVVCMTMVLLTLATISLDVVHFTMKATNKNIQRTQAKITAEAALQEFINGYRQGETLSSTPADQLFDKLQTLASAGTADSPVVYNTGFQGMSDADFAQQFGETEIHLYQLTGTSFKVEAITKFATQTQTASITFAQNLTTQTMPSNTLESKKGNAVGADQLSMSVDGNVHYENDDGFVNYRRISRGSNMKAHVYSEMSIMIDDQTTFNDVYNKSVNNVYQKDSRYFNQASTVTIDGYVVTQNNVIFRTDVGKSDVNAANSEYSGGYDESNLGGFDGYLCVYKKIVDWNNGKWFVGTNGGSRVYDVFCRGFYGGNGCNTLTTINGINFGEEVTRIRETFQPAPTGGDYVNNFSNDGKFSVNGDMHVYRNDEPGADISENGALVIATAAGHVDSEALVINGDLYIDGDIYIVSGDSSIAANTIVIHGDLHMPSSRGIYIVTNNGTTSTRTAPGRGVTGIQVDGAYVDDSAWTGRHHMPEKGYLATTGDPSSSNTRERLSKTYEGASSNDIFTMSLDLPGYRRPESGLPAQSHEVLAAQSLANKFADAMTRTLDDTYFDRSLGQTKRVSQFYANVGGPSDTNRPITQINASVKLSLEEAKFWKNGSGLKNYYLVNLTNEDIIIALPIGFADDATHPGDLGAMFKVLSHNDPTDETTENHYVYFMWYYANDPDQCLYINNDSIASGYSALGCPAPGSSIDIPTTANDGTVWHAKVADMPVGGILRDASGTITGVEAGENRRNLEIHFGERNRGAMDPDGYLVSDYRLTLPVANRLDSTSASDPDQVKTSILASFNSNDVTDEGARIDNCIMYLVPDYASVYLCDVGCVRRAQGVIYAWNSQVQIDYTSNYSWYGQIKCDRFKWTGDATGDPQIHDLPMGDGSLLSYAARNNGGSVGTNKVEIQYYEY